MRQAFAWVALDGDFTVQTVAGYLGRDEVLLYTDRQHEVVDEEAFKAAMRGLAAGIVMVTTRHEGRPWGLTISSCCSLSLRPPQVLVSLRASTVSCREILRANFFGVSILSRKHRWLAEYGSAPGRPKFLDGLCERGSPASAESPAIVGALSHLDCTLRAAYPVSDHIVLVGRVRRAFSPAGGAAEQPLVYFDRRFWGLGEHLA